MKLVNVPIANLDVQAVNLSGVDTIILGTLVDYATKQVVAREHRTLSVFLSRTEDRSELIVETDDSANPWAIKLFTVRWSRSRRQYVLTPNIFLGDEIAGQLTQIAALAAIEGIDKYEAEAVANAAAEAELNRAAVREARLADAEAAFTDAEVLASAKIRADALDELARIDAEDARAEATI
jgi:hypothetical protein